MSESRFLKIVQDYLETPSKAVDNDNIWLINSGINLRRTVGILGMLLPVLLWLWVFIWDYELCPLPSISHYYYTRASSIFAIVLSLIAFFLVIYKYDNNPKDFVVSTIAGVFAFCIVLFPTSNLTSEVGYSNSPIAVTSLCPPSKSIENFHLLSAGIFLACLAYMSLCLFTISNKKIEDRGKQKQIRNIFYKIFGWAIIFSMLIMLSYFLCDKYFNKNTYASQWVLFYESKHLTFWLEAIAVESFGLSWLLKGKTFLVDEQDKQGQAEGPSLSYEKAEN
jgi:hypothetical protein